MSTNQAFIKAFRRDPPRTSAPPHQPPKSAHVRQAATAGSAPAAPSATPYASLASTIEIVAPDFRWPTATSVATLPQPAIGKRPLSSFAPRSVVEPALGQEFDLTPLAEPAFEPETAISAFRWPQVCRSLWERFADQYEHIAELLLSRPKRAADGGNIIGVGALHAGDGATTTLLCLAVAIAARKRSVILVDANFRAPRLAGLLGVQPTTSWQDVLEQGLPVAEAVIHAESDGVDLLPLDLRAPTAREPNGAQHATGLQTSITAGVLRYAYEIVLVDLGAILAPRSFSTVSHLIRNMRIESAIAVTDPKHAEADDFAVAGELLDETGCELIGLIENRTSLSR
ncbi:MAG: tyrosine-protein kinase family protein [Pirellulales bacterium]